MCKVPDKPGLGVDLNLEGIKANLRPPRPVRADGRVEHAQAGLLAARPALG